MQVSEKRKMIEVLRGLIGSGFIGNQAEVCEELRKKGYNVTQSTVSRTLKKMGAVKVSDAKGVRYELKSTGNEPIFRGSIGDLVLSCQNNEATIVIKTSPGSAMFVAGFIDHYCHEDIIGSVAGDDTIFLAPVSIKKISLHKKNIIGLIQNH